LGRRNFRGADSLFLRTVWTVKFGAGEAGAGFCEVSFGGGVRFCGGEPWNGKLFHVEQFEIGKNDGGFAVF